MKCRYEKKKSICSKTISMLGIWMTFYGVTTLKGQISAHTQKKMNYNNNKNNKCRWGMIVWVSIVVSRNVVDSD